MQRYESVSIALQRIMITSGQTNQLAVVITDALIARDVAVQHLQSACASLRDKEETIARLEREKKELKLLNDMGSLSVDEAKNNPLMEERTDLLDKIGQLERSNTNLTRELQRANEMPNNELKVNQSRIRREAGMSSQSRYQFNITSPLLSPNPATVMHTPRMTIIVSTAYSVMHT